MSTITLNIPNSLRNRLESIAKQEGIPLNELLVEMVGKIARDQHVPALAANPDWHLAATVSRSGSVDGVESFTDFNIMLAQRPDIGVISLCLPPQPRFAYADAALRAGRHVMLEKPPGQSLAEVHALQALAAACLERLLDSASEEVLIPDPALEHHVANRAVGRRTPAA